MNSRDRISIFHLIKTSTLLLIGGLGVAHFTGNQPYGVLFINNTEIQQIFGVTYLLVFIVHAFIPRTLIMHYRLHVLLPLVSVISLINSYGSYIKSAYVPEQMIEHAIMIFLPLLFFVTLITNRISDKQVFILKLLTALTFLGHGLFAIGFHYVPEGFISMTGEILQFNHYDSLIFLKLVGILDLLVAVLIFLPKQYASSALLYMAFWGLITALARIVYGGIVATNFQETLYYIASTMYRLPHGLVPIILLLQFKGQHPVKIGLKAV